MANILFVDNDLNLARTICDWLLFENHTVDMVHTGFEGWQKANSNKYDLLILDWDLPDLNGIDILQRLRASGNEARVLMLTGRNDVNDKELGFESGADDYLTKPFHIKELSARIRAILRRAESQSLFVEPLGSGNEEVLKKGDLAGTLLASRYEFLEVLGEGGLGLVFKAMHPLMEKLVAIKMLHAHELKEESIERFKREAKAISKLDHHNIITIHDFGVTERSQPFMVMEYIDGLDLARLIEKEGALPVDRALDILIQACEGICHAHELGILHRDLKPTNMMLKQYGNKKPIVKILDFGFARLTYPDSKKTIELTQVGQVFGSPPYMSPEQVRGKILDERSDVYSMACVLYEAITGRPPYTGDNRMDVMLKHLEDSITPLCEARPDLTFPEQIEPVIQKALSRSADDRYESMTELKEELEKIQLLLKVAQRESNP